MPQGNALDNAQGTRNIARHASRQKHKEVQKSSANQIGGLAKSKLCTLPAYGSDVF